MPEPHGLLLPPDVIQPFLLRFRRDDLHIMATFTGHPDYEAVEAMIRYRADGTPSIRAIVTRHDQTQIDHVNDERLQAQAHGVARQTCYRPIDLDVGARQPPQARLVFASHAGEQIVLDITAAGPPSTRQAGLTDPGMHSPNSSLPVMWRGASTLAGPQTRVTIDGRDHDVPVKISTPAFVAHQGYYTERHSMAVVRAGTVRALLRRRPQRIETGAEWLFEAAGGETRYRVAECDRDGVVEIENAAGDETIQARAIGNRLDVTSIRLRDGDPLQPGFDLAFAGQGRFSIAVDEARDLVTGELQMQHDAGGSHIRLVPTQPGWAASRCIDVHCGRAGDEIVCVTRIGDGTA